MIASKNHPHGAESSCWPQASESTLLLTNSKQSSLSEPLLLVQSESSPKKPNQLNGDPVSTDHVCKYVEQITQLLVRMETVHDRFKAGQERFDEIERTLDTKLDIVTKEITELKLYQHKVNIIVRFFVWVLSTATGILSIPHISSLFDKGR
ncbi:MAG: hypothetical protein HQL86_09275 [Magnetococcales bacterium]|nr:hypothetical protein [Magnetococcales bacterium]